MAQILLDTDVLIAVLRGSETAARRMEESQESGDLLGYSPITVAELWRGMRPREEEPTRQLLRRMTCLPVDQPIGRLGGQYLQRYHRSHGITLPDALIAATAVLHRSSLWTLNRRHYPMPELSLIT